MHLSIPPGSVEPVSAAIQAALARLNDELALAADGRQKAVLLHELGCLREAALDDHRAAAALLAAINADPTLQEPLEQLLALLQRRSSSKNIPRILERMLRLAQAGDTKARVEQARAEFLVDVSEDPEAALEAWQSAQQHTPDAADLWLASQLLGATERPSPNQTRALSHRHQLATSSLYQAELQLSFGHSLRRAGKFNQARTAFLGLAKSNNPCQLKAWQQLAGLAQHTRDPELAQRALQAQVQCLTAQGSSVDVPAIQQQAAMLSQVLGDAQAGQQLQASAVVNGAQLAPLLALTLANTRKTQTAMQTGANAPLPLQAAPLFARALTSLAKPNTETPAMLAAQQATAISPEAVLGHTIALNELRKETAPNELAETLADAARFLTPRAATQRGGSFLEYQLLSAFAWSLAAQTTEQCRKALSVARTLGLSSQAEARTGRLLAILCNDEPWRIESGQRLLTYVDENETTNLLFEELRAACLSARKDRAYYALEELGESQSSELAIGNTEKNLALDWCRNLLVAYLFTSDSDGASEQPSLDTIQLAARSQLASLTAGPKKKLAQQHWLASLTNDNTALESLVEQHPDSAELSLALYQKLKDSDPTRASGLLRQAAAHQPDATQAPLELTAALLTWHTGDRVDARAQLENRLTRHSSSSAPLLKWALRLTPEPDLEAQETLLNLETGLAFLDIDTRQKLKDSSDWQSLELLRRACLELAQSRKSDALTTLSRHGKKESSSEINKALSLIQRLISSPSTQREPEDVHDDSSLATQLGAVLLVLSESKLATPSTSRIEAASQTWAKTGSLTATLQWLLASVVAATETEVSARLALASQLDGKPSAALIASSQLVALIHGKSTATHSLDSAAVHLANLELCPPGSNPPARAAALSSAAPLLGTASRRQALTSAGYNHLAARNTKDAAASFEQALLIAPNDLPAWEGIRSVAKVEGNTKTEADACHKLAALTRSKTKGAELLRREAELLFELGETEQADSCLERAVELDPHDRESFESLLKRLRQRNLHDKILTFTQSRERVTTDPAELGKLAWERARSYRALGELESALAEVDTLRILEPARPATLLLASEIRISQGEFQLAAEQLAALSSLESAPKRQRLLSGIAAADLYHQQLNNLESAYATLALLHASDLGGLPLIERLARTAALAKKWEQAAAQFCALGHLRGSAAGRAEAARLALVIQRDTLFAHEQAAASCELLLQNLPADPEGIDYALTSITDNVQAARLASLAQAALRLELIGAPSPEGFARLARIAEFQGNTLERVTVLGILAAIGQADRATLKELDAATNARVAELLGDQSSQNLQERMHTLATQAYRLADNDEEGESPPVDSETLAAITARLSHSLPEPLKEQLPTIAAATEPLSLVAAEHTRIDRAAALLLGDISYLVGEVHDRGALRPFDAGSLDSTARNLISFVLSGDFVTRHAKLGGAQ